MKKLKFIHITKTGGSSIEATGLNCNIRWGKFHYEYGWLHRKFTTLPRRFRLKYDWFTVVRNPFTRILSEYHWAMEKREQNTETNVKQFNDFICNSINIMLTLKKNSLFENTPCYIRSIGGHFTEQHLYIDKISKIHIIRYENLKTDFDKLMKKYRLNIKLNSHCNKSNKIYSISDLYPETIYLIQNTYKMDFYKFDYPLDPRLA